jgi:hypothetical protein
MQVFWMDNRGNGRADTPVTVFRDDDGTRLAVIPRTRQHFEGPEQNYQIVIVDLVLPEPPPRKIKADGLSIKAEIRALDKKIACDQADIERMDTLLELTYLRKPINFDPDWWSMMHFGLCPCPGVPREVWAPMEEER